MKIDAVVSFLAVLLWAAALVLVGRRSPAGRRLAVFGSFLPLALLGGAFASGWDWPDAVLAHRPAILAAALFALPVGLAAPGSLRRGGKAWTTVLVIVVVACAWGHHELLRPLSDRLTSQAESQGVVLQQHAASSSAAALASVLVASGCPMTESVVAGTMEATLLDVTPRDLAAAAAAFGCRNVRVLSAGEALPEGWALLSFRGEGLWRRHWVALMEAKGRTRVVADPAVGRRLLGAAELESLWDGTGVALVPPGAP